LEIEVKVTKFFLILLGFVVLAMLITSCRRQPTGLESLLENVPEITREEVTLEEWLEERVTTLPEGGVFPYYLESLREENPFDLEERVGFQIYQISNGSVLLDVPMFNEYFFPEGAALAEFNFYEVLRNGDAIIMHMRAQKGVQVRIESTCLTYRTIEEVLEDAVRQHRRHIRETFGVVSLMTGSVININDEAIMQVETRVVEGDILVTKLFKVASYMGYPVFTGIEFADIWGHEKFDYWVGQMKEAYGLSKFF
jgi:hypothetical protein